MSDDLVTIEVNGKSLQARKGAMLIEVTDQADIKVPRFCYHKKLSVAANCRMCLVEVEKAPKPLPACATPVMDGMKVYTHSKLALEAQKGTMEFLLINHPLDCPICDQGGECELQDIAMGYGEDVSRYTDNKRVVKDKDIGPLISTEMTRCIHCTRCVRFGEEIAGIRELGATGRGEHMQIGTYIAKSVDSELSANVIDLCPVGALTAKPSRFEARAWEMIQHASVAPHDAIGSNIYIHTLRGRVVRVVPRDNEALNESWISNRDRFSYEALYSDDRLAAPMIKRNGSWQQTDWDTALNFVAKSLRQHAPQDLGALVAPTTTLEEMYLAQKLMRGLGSNHIDHRLRQSDFSDQDAAPLFPWLGMNIEDLDKQDAVLLAGCNISKEQPIVTHRLRKAVLKGGRVMMVNPRRYETPFELSTQCVNGPQEMIRSLAGIASAVFAYAAVEVPESLATLLKGVTPAENESAIATELAEAGNKAILLGAIAQQHTDFALIRALCSSIAMHTGAVFGYLPEAGNSAGAWLAGVVPHRLPAGQVAENCGAHASALFSKPRKAYIMYGVEAELDCNDPATAQQALNEADFVAVFSPFASEAMRGYADAILPIATYAETSGTYVNAEGGWQSFQGAGQLPGEARPGWKLLRVLGNQLELPGFDYMSSTDVRDELKQQFPADIEFDNSVTLNGGLQMPQATDGLMRISDVPIYAVDNLVRRASALQNTTDAQFIGACVNPQDAVRLGLTNEGAVLVKQQGHMSIMPLTLTDDVPEGCVWMSAGISQTSELAAGFGPVSLQKVVS